MKLDLLEYQLRSELFMSTNIASNALDNYDLLII